MTYAASQLLSAIPPGQPILVGHHSEGRHRSHLRKVDSKMGQCVAESKKAEHYRRKADNAESNRAISSDNPEAVTLLQWKLRDMETKREWMKAINAAWRKAKKPHPDNNEGWQKVAELAKLSTHLVSELRASMRADFMVRAPFPSYSLTNLGGRIKATKDRIARLESESQAEHKETQHGAISVIENVEANRVQIIFPGKPDAETRATLKRSGFRWAPSQGAWQRHLNNAGRWAAEEVIKTIGVCTLDQKGGA